MASALTWPAGVLLCMPARCSAINYCTSAEERSSMTTETTLAMIKPLRGYSAARVACRKWMRQTPSILWSTADSSHVTGLLPEASPTEPRLR